MIIGLCFVKMMVVNWFLVLGRWRNMGLGIVYIRKWGFVLRVVVWFCYRVLWVFMIVCLFLGFILLGRRIGLI